MDEDAESPADANSFQTNQVLRRNILAFNKKRKLEPEFLSLLPIAKHKCYGQTSLFHEFESEEGGSNDGSSSFMTEVTDSAMSPLHGSSTHHSGDAKLHSSATTTFGLSSSWGTTSSENQMDSSSDGEGEENIDLPSDGPINIRQILEEQLLELGNNEYGHGLMEQCADNGTEVDIYSSSDGNPKNYVLSSGRWNVEQESSQIITRKPTIDQEFEQYFSMLML